jgi:prolyl oligopeptidase
MKLGFLALIGTTCLLPTAQVRAGDLPAAATERRPVASTYHGVTVVDDYRWLEEGGSASVREWSGAQNERTRAYFAALSYRDGIAQQLLQLRSDESAHFSGLKYRQGHIFALRFKPPAQQPVLIRLSSIEPPALWKVVFDPNAYNTNGTTSIDWFVPSPDGKRVAVSLSEGGSEQGTLHFFDAFTGKELGDTIPRVQYPTAGGSAAWTADGSTVLYTRYPRAGERPEADLNFYQQVWRHKLGTPVREDTYELGRDFPRIGEIKMESSEDGRWTLATMENGDGGDYAHYLRNPAGQWRQITRFEDEIKEATLGRDEAAYLVSRKGAPRGKILRLSLPTPDLAQATLVAPEREGVVQELAPADTGVYADYLLGGPSELVFFKRGSTRPQKIPIQPVSSVGGLDSWRGEELVFGNGSYVEPSAWYGCAAPKRTPHRTALFTTSPVSFDDIEVVREFAVSKDGTKVPLNILHRKGLKLDGQSPTILYGYGGYGISLTPGFDSTRRLWFDAGGVYVVANLRGGGEYGETWHKSGNLTQKQHVFDDFIAGAEHLVQRGYTRPARLAVMGGSNGGLTVGAFFTQRPELARAVVARVGIYDMLRVEEDPNGQFNVTEFGTVKDPEHFKAILAYSPYQHVTNGVSYPAVLFTTGENDGRVNPFQSRKMSARLQAASNSGLPILYRSTATAGHGIGSSLKDRVAEQADIYAFLFHELGVDASRWRFE